VIRLWAEVHHDWRRTYRIVGKESDRYVKDLHEFQQPAGAYAYF